LSILPLSDRDGPLFPELTAYLDGLERLGLPIVLMKPERLSGAKVAVPRPFLLRSTRNRVRAVARVGELPDDLTLAACRHGGITELGDAELTEQGVMPMTGHKNARRRPYLSEAHRKAARYWCAAPACLRRVGGTFCARSQNEAPAAESE
jgi:hypothetical protein